MACRDEIPIYEYGTDVIIQELLEARPTQRGESGTPYVQSNFSSITVSLFLIDSGVAYTVPGYDEASLTIANVIDDTLNEWDIDSRGYNFEHTIDADDLSATATYEVRYRFNLVGGGSFSIREEFLVRGPADAADLPIHGWRGAWSSGEDYLIGDAVSYLGSSWIATANNTNSTPPSTPGGSSTDWELLASIGSTGSTGTTGAAGAGYYATSTTSLAIGTGSKAFTTQSGLAYSVGARVRASSAADTSNYMEGLVTSYSGTTLTVNVTRTSGSGTLADWNINLAGDVGATGATGAAGSTGITGATGPGYTATSSTSLTIGTGFKTLSTQAGTAYTAGSRVRIVETGTPTNWMEGEISTYALTVMVVNVDLTSGSGTAAGWTISLSGEPGQDGSSLNMQGAWDSGTSYVLYDVVDHEGSSYVATAASTNSEPPNANWQLLASKGDDGADGADYIYNVTRSPYSAVGDGSNDDTAEIQAAFDAAATYSAAGGKPVVYFPEGTYKVGTSTLAGAEAVTLSGNSIKVRGPGIIKLASGSAADAALNVTGNFNQIEDITVDGNASGSPSGRGDCFYIGGNDNTITGVTCQNSKTSSGIDFLVYGDADTIEARTTGLRNTLVNCISRNAGYDGFDNRGDFTTLRDCAAHSFGTHGYNHAGYATQQVTIDGFIATASGTAVTALIIDPGSGETDAFVKQATIKNVRISLTGATATLSPMKVARVHDLLLDNVFVKHVASFSTIKIVEGCRNVTIRDSYFSRNIDFDELAPATGSITAAADNGSGYTQFSSTSHGLQKRDIVYIPDASVAGYIGLHEVTSVTANTFDTDFRVTTTGAITGNFYDCQGSVTLERVQVAEPGTSNAVFLLSGLRTPKLTMRGCRFFGCSTKAIALKETYPFTAVERIDVENCMFVFNRATAAPYVLVSESGSGYLSSSRKIRWANNTYRNVLAASVGLTDSTDSDILLTSLDGGRDYIASAVSSGTAVTWQVGDRFWKPTAVANASPGWICTTAGTFSGGGAGVFTPMPALANINTLVSDVTEVGNVGTGEDNLITYTLPANTLNAAGDSLEIEAGFSFAANANAKQVKMYFGASAFYASGSSAHNDGGMFVRATVTRDTSSIAKVGYLVTATGSGTPFALAAGDATNASADMTATVTIKGTGEATSNNDIVMEFLRVRYIPAP